MPKQFLGFVAALLLMVFASAAHAQSSMKMMIPANPGRRLGPDRAQSRRGDAERQTGFVRAVRQ